MILKRVALIVVFAMLAVGIGGAAGAAEMADNRLAGVAAADAGGLLLAQPDPPVVIVQQNPFEVIGAVLRWLAAYAGIALGEGVMNAAIALGANAFGLWQIGKNIWDASCAIGIEAERDIPLVKPILPFTCTLWPRWPY